MAQGAAHRGRREARRLASGRAPVAVGLATRRLLAGVAALLAVATVFGMVRLWPGNATRQDLRELGLGLPAEVYEADVLVVSEEPCEGTTPEQDILCSRVTVELREGPDAGRTATLEFALSADAPQLEAGDAVVLAREPGAPEGLEYRVLDRQRKAPLAWLALLFAATVVALGGLRGMAALAGLAATFVVLLVFVIPSILDGRSPVMVAVVGAAAIAFLALYLAHGFTSMTTVALLGTVASLALTAVLAMVFVEVAEITGLASEEATVVRIGAAQIDLAGLVLGGVVIGALGAIDDMTVTQASAVWELRATDPRMPERMLLRAGLRIGRDHVASTVNTLFLAYAGASMPLLILFVLSRQSLVNVANSEVVATEIVRTLVGSIGLVASVPITTWLAARTAPQAAAPPEPADRGQAPADPRQGPMP